MYISTIGAYKFHFDNLPNSVYNKFVEFLLTKFDLPAALDSIY